MPRIHPLVATFTAGEITPQLGGHVSLEKYQQALETLYNFLVLPWGGVTRRPGTRYVMAAKFANRTARIKEFVFSTSQAYVLEIGHQYIRFFKNGAPMTSGGVPVEVTTPYDESEVFGLDFVQSADVLYFLHGDVQTHKLERYSDTLWRFRPVTFTPPPSFEFGARPVATLTPSAVTGTVTLSASSDAFLVSDVGREVLVRSGANAGARATITAVATSQSVTALVTQDFVTVGSNASGTWIITESPKTTVTLSAASPVGASVTLTAPVDAWRGGINNFVDADCGRFVLINGGMVEITGVTSSTVAAGVLRGEAQGVTAAQSGEWTLEESLWSADNGFAKTGDFLDDRLYLSAGHRFAGSKVGDYENFGLGVVDDDAVSFAINSKQINTIEGILGVDNLFIFTAGAEYVARGGQDNPITPSNIQVSSQTSFGSSGVSPIRVGSLALFLTRSGKKLREFTLDPNNVNVAYVAPDLLRLSEHLTRDARIVDLAHQREPESRIWAVREDGVLLACTYLREENVVAWSRCVTGGDQPATTPVQGKFESVAVIPHPDQDREQVWVLVQRRINGATVRYIEYFDDAPLVYPTRLTDSSVLYSGASTTTVTGLGHLEGQTIAVQADGAVRPNATVTGGQITLTRAATQIEVGLPYTSRLKTVIPEVQLGAGTSQGLKRSWSLLTVRLLESIGLSVNGDDMIFRTAAMPLGRAPSLFTGDKEITHLGIDSGQNEVLQEQPLPCTILMFAGVLEVGDQ